MHSFFSVCVRRLQICFLKGCLTWVQILILARIHIIHIQAQGSLSVGITPGNFLSVSPQIYSIIPFPNFVLICTDKMFHVA